MKKLLIIAFSLLATTTFCVEKTVNVKTSETATTQMTQSNPVVATASTVSLGDSFMIAFGMGGNSLISGTTAESGNVSSSAGTVSAGSMSSALNVSTTVANGSVTIATPYGNAVAK